MGTHIIWVMNFSSGNLVIKKVFIGGLVWACYLKIISYLALYLSESRIIGQSDKWFRNESRNKTIAGKSGFLVRVISMSKKYLLEASSELVIKR